jgi:hypothetical protein
MGGQIMAWSNPPTNFTKVVRKDVEKGVKRIALLVLRNLISISPIDTGRFRGNWVVGIGNKNNASYAKRTRSSAEKQGASRINQFKPFKTIFISNNLPYARRLNEGWSEQAPANFVSLAVKRAAKGRRT